MPGPLVYLGYVAGAALISMIAGCGDDATESASDASVVDANSSGDGSFFDILDAMQAKPVDAKVEDVVIHQPDSSFFSSKHLAVHQSDFQTGNITLFREELPGAFTLQQDIPAYQDAVVRPCEDQFVVLNRFGKDSLQILDPLSGTLSQGMKFGNNTNPQDAICVGGKIFVSLYDGQNVGDLVVVDQNSLQLQDINPDLDGVQGMDLKPYVNNDAQKNPRAGNMILQGGKIFLLLQDLDGFDANHPGRLVRINPDTTQVEQTLVLSGRNPNSIVYDESHGTFYISHTGNYDSENGFGGIEAVKTATMESQGMVIDDDSQQCAMSAMTLSANNVYVICSDANFQSNVYQLATGALAQGLSLVYDGVSDIQTLLWLDNGISQLIVGDRNIQAPALQFINPQNLQVEQSVPTLLPPYSMAITE